jgi:hypothetical protein
MIAVSEDQLRQLRQIRKESEKLENLAELEIQYNKAVNWVYGIYVNYLLGRTSFVNEGIPHNRNLTPDLIRENKELSEVFDNDLFNRKRANIYPKFSLEVLNELEETFTSVGHTKFAPSGEEIDSIKQWIRRKKFFWTIC